ncbi:hypothetical protein [Fluviicola sp.]|uniref:hypothetical protein n=1 Tax=Fluviicola sp. TaxID=1917219 RepID=UPI00261A19CE|nr:hypothetical protein [Fluviicola sp.]
MKKIIICLFCTFAHYSFSQSEKGMEIGVQISTVLETNANSGLVPSLLLKYKQHECVFGVRIGFQQINNLVNESGEKKLIVNPDFAYRYFIPVKSRRICPYVSILFNYYHGYQRRDGAYDPNDLATYGPIFPYAFNLRTESVVRSCGLYLAPGLEIRLWKELFFNISGGPGLIWKKYNTTYTNLDSGQTERESHNKWRLMKSWNWFGNTGLGYRF